MTISALGLNITVKGHNAVGRWCDLERGHF